MDAIGILSIAASKLADHMHSRADHATKDP
jgi:hypothetical protein